MFKSRIRRHWSTATRTSAHRGKRNSSTSPNKHDVATLQRILEECADVICVIDDEARIVELSRSFGELLGYTRSELLGMDVRQLIPDEDIQKRPLPLDAMRAGRIFQYEREFRHKDGHVVTMELTAQALSDGQFMTVGRSVEERKVVEALRKRDIEQDMALRNQAHVLENIAEGVNYVDNQGIIRFTNAACDEMFGYERGELIGKSAHILNDLEPEENAKLVNEVLSSLASGKTWIGEFKNRKKDGTSFTTKAKIKSLPLQGEAHWVTVQEDITAQKRTEAALRQMHKMESLGSLAAGIAHDFNNILTVILGHTEMIGLELPRDSALLEDVEQIKVAADRAARLTKQLLVFSRKRFTSPLPVDLNAVVREMSQMLARLIGEDIRFSMVFSNEPAIIVVDSGELEQLLMNLVINARDAMPRGGRLTIETRCVFVSPEEASRHANAESGNHVVLIISDTGHGMDSEIQQRIFDPFFTTKPRGAGTGLGLAMVHGVAAQAGGYVTVESEVGRGANFRVYFPLSKAKTTFSVQNLPQEVFNDHGHERILVVEDDTLVRRFVSLCLRSAGYEVLEADTPSVALRLAIEDSRTIHLLVTDVVMPEMNGQDLAMRLMNRFPDLRVLFMSGYTDDAVTRHDVSTHQITFLRKPFVKETLTRKVRAALDTPSILERRDRVSGMK